jgi:hypothetical protein
VYSWITETESQLIRTGLWSVCVKSVIRRLGFAGFCFFLIKGLLWLALPLLAAIFVA